MRRRYFWLVIILSYTVLIVQAQPHRCIVDSPITFLAEHTHSNIHLRSDQIIPVVFHVVNYIQDDTISDRQIMSQIEILNREFAGVSRNDGHIPEAFRSLRGFANIRFCLASIDPDGNETTGINRHQTNIQNIADAKVQGGRTAIHYDQYDGLSGWPSQHYINIWVGSAQFFGGKATFPNEVTFAEEEGIILDPRHVGDIGLARHNKPYHLGKTLIHEMGHYFNLPHIWGSGSGGECANDDGIADTPFQRNPYTGCPSDTKVSCDSPDMYINYMDNTDDNCIRMFTKQQVNVILSTLQAQRSGLANNGKCTPNTFIANIMSASYISSDSVIEIKLNGTDGEDIRITLYDIQGREIINQRSSAFDTQFIHVDNLIPGIYIIRIVINELNYTSKLLIN